MTSSDQRATARALRTWERMASQYDQKIASIESGLMDGGREWLGARATGRTLEVGVGTGRSLPHYTSVTSVTGVDLSPAMLDRARATALEVDFEVDLQVADAESLPFDDGGFDTVVCALALCAIPDDVAALREMQRVLAPGGRLLLLDHIRSSWPPIHAGQWLVERFTIPTSGEHMTRRPLHVVQSMGFEIVETERLKLGIAERVHARKPF